ncbi:hypothetical protein ACKGJI_06190 [Sulfurospirillum sp. 1307]
MATLLLPPMKLVNGELVSDPKNMKFDDIQKRVELIFLPENKNNSAQAFKDSVKIFWEELMKNHAMVLKQKAYYI